MRDFWHKPAHSFHQNCLLICFISPQEISRKTTSFPGLSFELKQGFIETLLFPFLLTPGELIYSKFEMTGDHVNKPTHACRPEQPLVSSLWSFAGESARGRGCCQSSWLSARARRSQPADPCSPWLQGSSARSPRPQPPSQAAGGARPAGLAPPRTPSAGLFGLPPPGCRGHTPGRSRACPRGRPAGASRGTRSGQ